MAYTPPESPFTVDFGGADYTSPESPFTVDFASSGSGIILFPPSLEIEIQGQIPFIVTRYPSTLEIEIARSRPRPKTLKPTTLELDYIGAISRPKSIKPLTLEIEIAEWISSRLNEPLPLHVDIRLRTPRLSTYKPLTAEIEFELGTASIDLSANITFVEQQPGLAINTEVFIKKLTVSKRIWFLIVSDGINSSTIPMVNFTETLNDTGIASYQLVIPNGGKYLSFLTGKTHFIIKSREIYIDNSYNDTPTQSIEITSVRPNKGGSNYSITILGKLPLPERIPKRLNITGVTYESTTSEGLILLRCSNNMDFFEGDTAVLPDGSEFTAGVVTRIISVTQKNMQLREAVV